MDRNAPIARYRLYREIVGEHKSAALDHLSGQTVLDQARFLRVANGRTIVAVTPEEHTLVLDLAIHAPLHKHSLSYERYRGSPGWPKAPMRRASSTPSAPLGSSSASLNGAARSPASSAPISCATPSCG